MKAIPKKTLPAQDPDSADSKTAAPEEAPGRPAGQKFGKIAIPHTFTHCAVAALVLAPHFGKIVTPEEEALLRRTHVKLLEFRKQIVAVSVDSPKREKREATAAYTANPTSENFQRFQKAAELDIATIRARAQSARDVIKAARGKMLEEIRQMITAIFLRTAALVEEERDRVAATEAETAERYGVPYQWSETVGGLENLARMFRTFIIGRGDVQITSLLRDIHPF
jgi:hypothetical protein